jgi:hypothetical protein
MGRVFNHMFQIKKITIGLIATLFACHSTFAALIGFDANVKLDLLSPTSTLYILNGSTANSITFSATYNEAVVQIPAGSNFKIGSSGSRYFSITPSSATVTLTFRDTFVDEDGYITSWILESSTTTNVDIRVHTRDADTSYAVFDYNTKLGYYNSDSDALMRLVDSLDGEKTYAFNEGGPPSGSSGSRSSSSVSVKSVGAVVELTPTTTTSTTNTADKIETPGGVDLAPTEGTVTQPVTLYNSEEESLTVEIPQHTEILDSEGEIFSGVIAAPDIIETESVEKSVAPQEKVIAAILIDAPGKRVSFSNPIKINIPIKIEKVTNPENLKVFYYDKRTNKYRIAGDGGKLSADRKSMEIEVKHLTLFAVFETNSTEIPLKIFTEIYSDIAASSRVRRPSAPKAEFLDVPNDSWFTPYVSELSDAKIITGYADGNFHPEQAINRAEIVKIATTAFELDIPELSEDPFADVSRSEWFAPFVAAAKSAGIVSGSSKQKIGPLREGDSGEDVAELQRVLKKLGFYKADDGGTFGPITRKAVNIFQYNYPETHEADGWGTVGEVTLAQIAELSGIKLNQDRVIFRPDDLVSRAEALKILILASGLELQQKASFSKFNDVAHTEWFIRFVNLVEKHEIISGFPDGSFRPNDLINRAQIAKIVSLLLELREKEPITETSETAETPAPKLSFWQRLSPKYLLGNLFEVFR